MNFLTLNRTASILKRSTAHKSKFGKLRDELLGINEEALAESTLISNKIKEMQSEVASLSTESQINAKVIKNIDKILGE